MYLYIKSASGTKNRTKIQELKIHDINMVLSAPHPFKNLSYTCVR